MYSLNGRRKLCLSLRDVVSGVLTYAIGKRINIFYEGACHSSSIRIKEEIIRQSDGACSKIKLSEGNLSDFESLIKENPSDYVICLHGLEILD
ncbi:MAG: hypothetical protein KJ905_02350 [Nanoarchaeota archaeon]|nr:hypothetical protein [Nanoarchaeota archaeon]MBU1501592.1 hypothetical protein [Nanoarchaeota archaeon]MBU2458990.1 hypothetical protein [Nanoarchaeota archaeon]